MSNMFKKLRNPGSKERANSDANKAASAVWQERPWDGGAAAQRQAGARGGQYTTTATVTSPTSRLESPDKVGDLPPFEARVIPPSGPAQQPQSQSQQQFPARSSSHQQHSRQISGANSSLYSQPSPVLEPKFDNPRASGAPRADVSPATTAADRDTRYGDFGPRPVSPIDLTYHNGSSPASNRVSSIGGTPESNRDSRLPVRRKPTGSNTRWDVYSGEPTTGENGRPGSVRPGEFTPPADLRKALRPVKKDDHPSAPVVDNRPPWKGASGRQAIVEAPKDTGPRKEPIKVPPPPAKDDNYRPSPTTSPNRTNKTASPITAPSPEQYYNKKERQASSPTLGRAVQPPERASASPTSARIEAAAAAAAAHHPALRVDTMNYDRPLPMTPDHQQSAAPPMQQNSYPSPVSPSPPAAVQPEQSQVQEQQTSPPLANDDANSNMINDTASAHFHRSGKETPGSAHLFNGEASSRFSWTTQATNTTYQHSPPPSPVPPMPQMRQEVLQQQAELQQQRESQQLLQQQQSSPAPISSPTMPHSPPYITDSPRLQSASPAPSDSSSVMNRRRPLPSNTVVGRKPITSPMSAESTASLRDRVLPPTPAERAQIGQDAVDTIQRHMDDLVRRRRQAERLVAELDSQEHRNPLVQSWRQERERERRVKELQDQVTALRREEHDAGLRLHRAWKRREKSEGIEMTTLWVRRVAS